MTLSPLAGSYARLYYCPTGTSEISDEAMQEVDLSAYGHDRYTVYEITSASTRYLNDDEVPVFQADTAGNSVFEAITPSTIEYVGGRIFLSSARGATDVVRCHSGHYLTPAQMLGAAVMKFTDKRTVQECTCYGDTAVERRPTIDSWDASAQCFYAAQCAEYTTTGGNDNSHITVIHTAGGDDGNNITITLADPGGNNQVLTLLVVANDITVSLATGPAGAITSTAAEVAQAINEDLDVQALNVWSKVKAGETGAGIVAPLAQTNLAGGADAIDFGSLKGTRVVCVFYLDYSGDARHEGFGYIDSVDWAGKDDELVKADLSIISGRYKLYRRTA